MQRRQIFIYGFICLSFVALLLFVTGFVTAVREVVQPGSSGEAEFPIEDTPSETEMDNEIHLVALGDSLTRGVGDSEGEGYVGYIKKNWSEAIQQQVIVHNLGVSGNTSAQLLEQLERQHVLDTLSRGDVVTITIGGNDLFRGVGEITEIDMEQTEQTMDTFAENVKQIISAIRNVNQDSPIYLVGLYDPFVEVDETGESTRLVHEWNYRAQKLVQKQENVVLVPVFDLFQKSSQTWLSNDHFHLNHEGYVRMGERLMEHISISFDMKGESSR